MCHDKWNETNSKTYLVSFLFLWKPPPQTCGGSLREASLLFPSSHRYINPLSLPSATMSQWTSSYNPTLAQHWCRVPIHSCSEYVHVSLPFHAFACCWFTSDEWLLHCLPHPVCLLTTSSDQQWGQGPLYLLLQPIIPFALSGARNLPPKCSPYPSCPCSSWSCSPCPCSYSPLSIIQWTYTFSPLQLEPQPPLGNPIQSGHTHPPIIPSIPGSTVIK